jgi:hypothetical protein
MMPVMSDEEDLIDLKHAVDRHEHAITEDAIQIAALKSEIETLREQLKADVEGLIQILGLFRDTPYFQPPAGYPEIKQKLDAVVAEMRKRHPSLKPFEV